MRPVFLFLKYSEGYLWCTSTENPKLRELFLDFKIVVINRRILNLSVNYDEEK
jgi:hypothetical protein